jgi:flavin-dependent dehydrogenase
MENKMFHVYRIWASYLKVGIIGAGPSGLALARILSERGYNVYVYEAHNRFAVKPCGWGFPVLDPEEAEHGVFLEAVRASIWSYSGYNVYLDDEILFHSRNRILGYIVDKEEYLNRLSQGIDVELGSPARYMGKGVIRGRNGERRYDIVVIAGGFVSQPKELERILAIQAIVRAPTIEEPEIPELRFYSDLVGYAWIFPEGDKIARIGVGGFANRGTLEKILKNVIKKRPDISKGEVVKREGAEVTVSGVDLDLAETRDPYYVGEAIGSVLPATGEGIRPSIWSSIALFRSIDRGTSYIDELQKLRIARAMKMQRRILDLMLKLSPRDRGEFLRSIPEDLMLRIALGKYEPWDLFIIARIPKIVGILARYSINILLH